MAKVENVAGVLRAVVQPIVGQHRLGALQRDVDAGEHERRVEVALHHELRPHPYASVENRRPPVETDDRRAGGEHLLQQVVAADAKVDAGSVGMKSLQLTEDRARVGQYEAFVVECAEGARPGIEQLERTRPVAELAADGRHRVLHQSPHQRMPQHWISVHELFGVLVGAAGATLDQVAGDGERRTGECQQRYLAGKGSDQLSNGFEHVGSVGFRFELPKSSQVRLTTKRSGADRAGAGCDIDTEPDGMGRDHDVAVQHRRVDAIASDRLHCQLGGQFGHLDGVENASLAAQCSVLGQAAAGLTHEPHGSVSGRAAECRVEEGGRRHRLGTLPSSSVLRPVHQTSVPGDQFRYQPALDGLRGVAVALVLFFHGGFTWMAGGYVGVSVFFTLSGYLITSLLILEHQRTGTVSWSSFVARRAKRLLPASLLCLVAISVLAWSGEFSTVPHLRRDIIASALQVANWNALNGSGSYSDLLSRAAGVSSPVDHYWSLAVEEQFYWVWPFAFLLVLRVSKGRARLFANLVVLALLGVVAARVIAKNWGPEAAYWATPARLGEILVGAALAGGCLLWEQRSRWLGLIGVAGLGVVLWTAVEWPTRGGPAYDGWLGVFSLASAALILGLQTPGLLRRVFSIGPLVWLGRISYGVYVYHWPVFVLASGRSLDLSGWSLFLARIAITLAVAMLSYWLIEQPVRRSRRAPRVAMSLAVPVSAVVVVLALLVVPAEPGRPSVRASASPATSTVVSSGTVAPGDPTVAAPDATVTTTATTTTLPVPDVPVNVVLIGDSTAVALSSGLTSWAAETTDRVERSVATIGCGLIRNTLMLGDESGKFSKQCAKALDVVLPEVMASNRPDTAMVMITIPDLTRRQWSGDEGMLAPSDPRYTDRMLDDYRSTVETLLAGGVSHIAWVVPPVPGEWWIGWMADSYKRDNWQQLVTVLSTIESEYPEVVQLVRLDEWFRSTGAEFDPAVRDDGLHLTDEGAQRVMRELLGPVLLRLSVV